MVTVTQDNSAQTGGVTSYIYSSGTTFYGYLYNQDSSYLYFDNANILNYTMGSGNDVLTVQGQPLSTPGNKLNLNGGAGMDVLNGDFSNLTTVMTLTNSSLTSSTLLTATNFERYSLTLGSAADSVTLTNRLAGEYLDGGAGKDSLNVDNSVQSAAVNSSISDGGDGTFTGYFYNSSNEYLNFNRFETLTYKMGTGSDVLNIGGGALATVGNSITVDAGAGAGIDTLSADLSAVTANLTMTNAAFSGTGVSLAKFEIYSVTFGSGNDASTLSNRSANEVLSTGSGKDTVTIDNSTQTVGVSSSISDGGSGTFSSSLYNRAGNYTYVYGNEVLTYKMGKGDDTVSINAGALATAGNSLTVDGNLGTDTLSSADLSAVTANLTMTNSSISGTGVEISNFEVYSSVSLGSGSDSVTLSGAVSVGSIAFGEGDDVAHLTDRTTYETLDGDTGVDSMTVDNSVQSVGVSSTISNHDGSSFSGYLYNSGGAYTYYDAFENLTYLMGTGDDSLSVNGIPLTVAGTSLTLDGGAGTDTLSADLSTVTVDLTMTNSSITGIALNISSFETYGTLYFGSGTDSIALTGTFGLGSADLGAGDDGAELGDRKTNESLSGGIGIDDLMVDNSVQSVGVSSTISNYDGNSFSGYLYNGSGAYTYFYSFETLTYAMGTGDDNLVVNGIPLTVAGTGLTLDGGAGTDTLSADMSTAVDDIAVTGASISGVSLSIAGFEAYGSLSLGSGDDSVDLSGAVTATSIDLAAGDDTVDLSDRVISESVHGGTGTDALTVDNSTQTTGVSGNLANYDGSSFYGYLYNASGAYTYFTAFENLTYLMGTGDDSLSVTGIPLTVAGTSLTLDGGSGTDSLSADLAAITVDVTVTNTSIVGIDLDIANFETYASLGLGSGDDTVTLSDRTAYENLGGGTVPTA